MLKYLAVLLLFIPAASAEFLDDFAKQPEVLGSKISPKGDYLGVMREIEEKRSVVIFEFPSMQVSSILSIPGRNEVADFWWVNDERILASVAQTSDRWEEIRSTGELLGMNADGTKSEHLFGFRAGGAYGKRIRSAERELASGRIIDRLWNDPDHVLIEITSWNRGADSRPVSAAKMDVYTGKLTNRVRAPGNDANIITDADGDIRFSLHLDDKQNLILHLRDEEANEWQHLATMPYGESRIIPHTLTDDNRIFVEYSPDGGPYGLYILDPETKESEVVYQHPIVDAIIQTDRYGQPYGVRTIDGRIQFTAIQPDHPRAQAIGALEQAFPGSSVFITSTTSDDGVMIVGVVTDIKTPEFFVFQPAERQLIALFDALPWIDESRLGKMEPIKVKARDGLELHGYLTLPQNSSGKNMPLVIVPHGGPHGPRDVWGYQAFEGFIPASGYAMLQINFRGSGGYGPEFERIGHRKWHTEMQDDLTDSVQWAIDQGIADPDRICIFGWSYGGYSAVMSIIREPDLYKCAVAGAGVYDHDVQYKDSDFATDTRWGKSYIDKVIGPTAEDRQIASPINYVEKIKTPLLLIHGDDDRRVPIEHSEDLVKRFKQAGMKPPELIKLKNEAHSPRNEKNIAKMFKRTIAFIDKHIGE